MLRKILLIIPIILRLIAIRESLGIEEVVLQKSEEDKFSINSYHSFYLKNIIEKYFHENDILKANTIPIYKGEKVIEEYL